MKSHPTLLQLKYDDVIETLAKRKFFNIWSTITIANIFESGKRMPTLLSLFHLSKGLNISSVRFLSLLVKKIELYERGK